MIKRIVKLTFKHGEENIFLNEILPTQKHFTRNFSGCNHLELWKDVESSNIIFSYSYWDSVESLNNYRHSDKFRDFWSTTKQHFLKPPYAVSVKVIEQI